MRLSRENRPHKELQRPQSSESTCDVLENKFSMFKVMRKGPSEKEGGGDTQQFTKPV